MTCKEQKNKDPNVDVDVLCNKGNDKGWKRQRERDGMKTLIAYATKQNRTMSTQNNVPYTTTKLSLAQKSGSSNGHARCV